MLRHTVLLAVCGVEYIISNIHNQYWMSQITDCRSLDVETTHPDLWHLSLIVHIFTHKLFCGTMRSAGDKSLDEQYSEHAASCGWTSRHSA